MCVEKKGDKLVDNDKHIITDESRVSANAAWIDLPVFSAEEAGLRDRSLAGLKEHDRLTLPSRERREHLRRSSDQLKVR
jgi:hypothetical protein